MRQRTVQPTWKRFTASYIASWSFEKRSCILSLITKSLLHPQEFQITFKQIRNMLLSKVHMSVDFFFFLDHYWQYHACFPNFTIHMCTGFPVIVSTTEGYKNKMTHEGTLVKREKEGVSISVKGRLVKIPLEIVDSVRLKKMKYEAHDQEMSKLKD